MSSLLVRVVASAPPRHRCTPPLWMTSSHRNGDHADAGPHRDALPGRPTGTRTGLVPKSTDIFRHVRTSAADRNAGGAAGLALTSHSTVMCRSSATPHRTQEVAGSSPASSISPRRVDRGSPGRAQSPFIRGRFDVERSLTFYLGLLDALGTHAGISAHRPFRASERCDRDARNSRKGMVLPGTAGYQWWSNAEDALSSDDEGTRRSCRDRVTNARPWRGRAVAASLESSSAARL